MDFSKSLIVFSLTNFIVLFLGSLVPGRYLVFGNAISSFVWALVITSILLGALVSLVGKAADVYNLKYSENVWMIVYLVVNVAGLYLLARTGVSEVVGVGIQKFWVAAAVGVVLNVAQYATWKTFLDVKNKK